MLNIICHILEEYSSVPLHEQTTDFLKLQELQEEKNYRLIFLKNIDAKIPQHTSKLNSTIYQKDYIHG